MKTYTYYKHNRNYKFVRTADGSDGYDWFCFNGKWKHSVWLFNEVSQNYTKLTKEEFDKEIFLSCI